MNETPRRVARSWGVVLLACCGLVACGGAGGAGTGTAGGGSSTKIGLLLPESQTTRYESFDRPLFEARVAELCPDCEVVYANADQDASKQQEQAESALTQGIDVLVLDPVDSAAAGSMVQSAKAQDVPVVAYDRMITGSVKPDYYVSYDNEKVGRLQAQSLVEKLLADGTTSGDIVMINGAPTDDNSAAFKDGAHDVLDGSGFTVAAEFDTPEWKPRNAQDWMDGALLQVPDPVGVYAANDGTAGGVIAAMKAADVDPIPPVTGQDAELAGVQRIVSGDQYMTVFKAYGRQAEAAAEAALALADGREPTSTSEVDGIPALLLDPVAVTADNVETEIIGGGLWTADEICAGEYAAACKELGIS